MFGGIHVEPRTQAKIKAPGWIIRHIGPARRSVGRYQRYT
jgi:hypothetical protein